MEIVVLIKEIPDLNVWVEIEPKALAVDPHDIVYIPNPCDLAALCAAVRLVDSLGVGSVTAMLLGPKQAEKTLRKCLDYGVNRAMHLIYDDIAGLEGHQIALILAEAIRRLELPYDLIFAGHDSSGCGFATGQIGTQVGAYLNLPQVSQVNNIRLSQDHRHLIVESSLDFGDKVRFKCSPPLSVSFHPDAEETAYPSFQTSMDALDSRVEQMVVADYNALDIERKTNLLCLSAPRPRPKKVFSPESSLSAAERIRLVMGAGLEKRQSEFLENSAKETARHVFDFLIQKRIISPSVFDK